MKKNIVRLLAICLALVMLLSSAMAEPTTDVSYTITEKLLKQMEAGSGFSARLTAQADAVAGLEAEAVTTLKPLEFDVSLIRVREDAAKGTAADSRLILALMDGETTLASCIAKGDWKVVEGMMNQVYGQPKQQVETTILEPPKPLSPRKQKK